MVSDQHFFSRPPIVFFDDHREAIAELAGGAIPRAGSDAGSDVMGWGGGGGGGEVADSVKSLMMLE